MVLLGLEEYEKSKKKKKARLIETIIVRCIEVFGEKMVRVG